MTDRKWFWTAAELMSTSLPAPKWAVSGIIAEGVTILAGPPKVGKSWLAANVGLDVASGDGVALGGIDVQQGDVLLLALEDTARRLQSRLHKMLAGRPAPERLEIATEWPALNDGGTEMIDRWLTAHPAARLVVIDVLAKVRGRSPSNGNAYAEDYSVVNELKTIADRHQVAFLVVHHVRKMAAVDFLEQVSGTNGIAGAADCTIVLTRLRGELAGELNITGRDVEEASYAMVWRPETGRWDLDGNGLAEASAAAQRAEISHGLGDRSVEIITFIGRHAEGVRAGQVAEHLEIDADKVRPYLNRLEKSGRIGSPSRGLYAPVTSVTSVTEPALNWKDAADHPDVTLVTVRATSEMPDQNQDVTLVTHITGQSADIENTKHNRGAA